MDGRAEHRRLLNLVHLFQRPHHLDRPGRVNLQDRPVGEYLLQLPRRPDRGQPPGMNDREPVAVLRLVEVMGRHEDGDPRAGQILDEPPETPARHRVHTAGRLVQEDDGWLVQNRAAERQTLAPAAGQIARQGPLTSSQAGHFDDEFAPFGDPLVVEAVQPAEEPDVLVDCQQFIQGEPLGHVADAALHLLGIAAHVDAADDRGAGGRLEQAAEHADGRRLAGAVGAEEAEDFSLLHIEADVIDGHEPAEASRQIANDDGAHDISLGSIGLETPFSCAACAGLTVTGPARGRVAQPPNGRWRAHASNRVRPEAALPARPGRRCWWRPPPKTARSRRGGLPRRS